MTLGQRIKEARLERRMTQQELVGDYITRNMLSKIENDAATPSVRTLEYLAAAMKLPPGSFLPGELGEGDSPSPLLLEQMLTRDDPEFPRRLVDARRAWEDTGLALLLLEAEYCLKTGDAARAESLLREMRSGGNDNRRFKACLLRGLALLETGRAAEATLCLREAEALSDAQPLELRVRLYGALETCYREQGDFQKAYFYAKKVV